MPRSLERAAGESETARWLFVTSDRRALFDGTSFRMVYPCRPVACDELL